MGVRRTAALFPLVALVLSLLAGAVPASPQAMAPAAAPETRRAEKVAPGIERIEIRRGDFSVGLGPDRWVINVLVLDPSRTRLVLGRAGDKGVGTETTSSIARRHGALAAVNAGFFRTAGPYRGEPAGILLVAGKVLSEPYQKRPGLAVTNKGGRTRLAVVDAEVRVEAVVSKSVRRRVAGVNRPRLDDELILFTPEFDRTTLTGPDGAEAIVERGQAASVIDGKGAAAIPLSGWVLSGHGAAAGLGPGPDQAGDQARARDRRQPDPRARPSRPTSSSAAVPVSSGRESLCRPVPKPAAPASSTRATPGRPSGSGPTAASFWSRSTAGSRNAASA